MAWVTVLRSRRNFGFENTDVPFNNRYSHELLMTQYDLEGKILFLRRFVAEIAREFSIPSPSLERLYCEKRDRVVLIRRTAFSAKTETAVDFIYLFS